MIMAMNRNYLEKLELGKRQLYGRQREPSKAEKEFGDDAVIAKP
jgi:hypothetical protein